MRNSLESIYREHRLGLFTLAMSITRQQQTAEDAVHDAFVRLCQTQHQPTGSEVAYVFAAVRNAAIEQLRRKPRPVNGNAQSIYTPAEPGDALMSRERDDLLRQAVEGLPDEQRQAVVMRLYAGLTFEQMAEVTGEPLSTVSSRYRRALEQLRLQVEQWV